MEKMYFCISKFSEMSARHLVFLVTLLATFAFAGCDKEEDFLARDRQIIEDYLEEKGLTASSTAEGIYYVVDNAGGSDHPDVYSTVKVHYKGYLMDGTVFDQTSGNAATFSLSSTIRGWQIGIPKFGKGGKGKLLIPSDYGYGSQSSADIPARSVLVFDIVLSDFY
jgi:FKBP-type peptidyl-prolyl cis-trans isomerase FkpA